MRKGLASLPQMQGGVCAAILRVCGACDNAADEAKWPTVFAPSARRQDGAWPAIRPWRAFLVLARSQNAPQSCNAPPPLESRLYDCVPARQGVPFD